MRVRDKKNTNNQSNRGQKGITIIALIITIVVLLLLVGIMVLTRGSKEKATGKMKTVAVTAEKIAEDKNTYYGKEVKNYTKGGTYRIFYVDKEGKFGEANTIYLKADWTANDTNLNPYTEYMPVETTVLEKMNRNWAEQRLNKTKTWTLGEHCAAWLCDPTREESTSNQAFASYFDKEKANYVIGGPSVEMYMASYNEVSHTTNSFTLGCEYSEKGTRADTLTPGYIFTVNGLKQRGGGWYTEDDTVDYVGYSSMYCGYNGSKGKYNWWFASTGASTGHGCLVSYGYNAALGNSAEQFECGLNPIVALKPEILPEVEK